MMPGSAAGSSTWRIVSDLVAPSAAAPSRIACGTAVSASSANDEMNGISMMPITAPGTIAAVGETSTPIEAPRPRSAGETTSTAKKP